MRHTKINSAIRLIFNIPYFLMGLRYRHAIPAIIFSAIMVSSGFAQQSADTLKQDTTTTTVADSTKNSTAATQYTEASYPGGNKAWTLHVLKTVRFPENFSGSFNGEIIVTFQILESGKIKILRTSEGPEPVKDEAIRVVKSGDRWIPAYKDGKPIVSENSQKISFKIE